jgi:hypothetical protein
MNGRGVIIMENTESTTAIAEMWQGSDVTRLVGVNATLTNVRTGGTITGIITHAKVSVIGKDSPLYVEGLSFVSEVKVEGIYGSLDLATPFVSDYARKQYDHWLINTQA